MPSHLGGAFEKPAPKEAHEKNHEKLGVGVSAQGI